MWRPVDTGVLGQVVASCQPLLLSNASEHPSYDWPSGDVANFATIIGRTTPVGLFPAGASPYGCHDMAGNVNNWVQDWYWVGFGRFCVRHGRLDNPCLDDGVREEVGSSDIVEKIDRGGGYATAREHQEVLGCTRKVHWPPGTREGWNGFRTAMDAT